MVLHILLIPRLGRTDTPMCKVRSLGRLPVGLDGAAFFEGDLAVVACAAGGGAVCYRCAGKAAFYRGGVDAGFEGWVVGLVVWVGREEEEEGGEDEGGEDEGMGRGDGREKTYQNHQQHDHVSHCDCSNPAPPAWPAH